MVKFVWLEVGDGARVPVNPDQVRYLKRTREGKTAIVFSAMPGGFDELVIEIDAAAAVAALEGARRDWSRCACGGDQVAGNHHSPTCDYYRPDRASPLTAS